MNLDGTTQSNEEWLTVKEVATLLGCTPQNVHHLINGVYRPTARMKKITPPKINNVKTIMKGKYYVTYLINKQDVEEYLSKYKGETA